MVAESEGAGEADDGELGLLWVSNDSGLSMVTMTGVESRGPSKEEVGAEIPEFRFEKIEDPIVVEKG